MVEATGVELFDVLITRILLILGTATRAKKAPLPDPFVRLLYENTFGLKPAARYIPRSNRPQVPEKIMSGQTLEVYTKK